MKQIVSHMAVKFEVKIFSMTFSWFRLARLKEGIYLDRINSAFRFIPIHQIGAISETMDLIDQSVQISSVKIPYVFLNVTAIPFSTLVHIKHKSTDQITK